MRKRFLNLAKRWAKKRTALIDRGRDKRIFDETETLEKRKKSLKRRPKG